MNKNPYVSSLLVSFLINFWVINTECSNHHKETIESPQKTNRYLSFSKREDNSNTGNNIESSEGQPKSSNTIFQKTARNLLSTSHSSIKKPKSKIPVFNAAKYRNKAQDLTYLAISNVIKPKNRPKLPIVPVRTNKKTEEVVQKALEFVNASENLACSDSILQEKFRSKNKTEAISLINELCDRFDPTFSSKEYNVVSLDYDSVPQRNFSEVSELERFSYSAEYVMGRLLTTWRYIKICCENRCWNKATGILDSISRRTALIYGNGSIRYEAAIWFFKLYEDGYENIYF